MRQSSLLDALREKRIGAAQYTAERNYALVFKQSFPPELLRKAAMDYQAPAARLLRSLEARESVG